MNLACRSIKLIAPICRCSLTIMGYLYRGYFIVCLSPIISLVLLLGAPLWRIGGDWFLDTVILTLIHVPVIVIQLLGLALCFVGILKNEHISYYIIPEVLLILWGCFTIYWALGWYGDLLEWSRDPLVRSLTLWDHLQYVTWALKGVLWILSGAILLKRR